MRLPNVKYGGVQSLGRVSPQEEAATAALPYQAGQQVVGQAYEAMQHYDLLQDQENALSEANKSASVNSVLKGLKENEINLSSLPQSVQQAYRASEGYDDTLHGFYNDSEFAPTHRVAQSVYDWANDELKGSNERLRSKRAQALYNETIGNDINKSFEDAATGIRGSQLNALRVQTDVAINNANNNGDIDSALRHAQNGYNTGIYTPAALQQRRKDIFRFNAEVVDGNQVILQNQAYDASFAGNRDLKSNLEQQYRNQMKDVKKYGSELLNDAEINEYTRKLNQQFYQGDVDGKAQRVAVNDSISTGLSWVESQERQLDGGDFSDLPEGVTVADAKASLSKSRSRIQERHNALTKATKQMEGGMLLASKAVSVNKTLTEYGGVLPNSGEAYNDYSDIYKTERQVMMSNGADWTQVAEHTLNSMNHHGQMPKYLKDMYDSVDRQDPTTKLQLAREFAYYRANAPELARKYAGDNLGYLTAAANQIAYGSPESNSEAMIDQLDKAFVKKPEEYEFNIKAAQANQQFTPKKMKELTEDVYNEVFDTSFLFWGDNPDMGTRVGMAVQDMYKHEIGKGADHDSAVAVVEANIANNVGASFLDKRYPEGKTTFLPPEKVYGEFVHDQADKLKAEQFKDYNADGIYFETDGLTMYQEQPSYKIMYADPDNPDATPYQLTSWDQGGVDRGVITGASGARWRPNSTDTEGYKAAQDEQASMLSDGRFIKEQQAILHDTVLADLRNSGLAEGASAEDIQLSITDAWESYRQAHRDLAKNPRFYTAAEGDNVRNAKTVFDKEEFQKASSDLHKAAKSAAAQWKKESGFELPADTKRREKAEKEAGDKRKIKAYRERSDKRGINKAMSTASEVKI